MFQQTAATMACPHGRMSKACCFLCCGGAKRCRAHRNIKAECAPCRTSAEVGRCKRLCADHGRRKDRCVDCHQKRCEHGQYLLRECRDCGRGRYCIHGIRKYMCLPCGGRSVCPHGRYKA